MNRRFDAVVIGAGQAGPPMVGRLAAAGQKVALIERKLIGGTCVNTGCTPTKAMVASAYAAHLARRGADFGVNVGQVSVDFAAVMARKNTIVGDFSLAPYRLAAGHGELHPPRGTGALPVARRDPGRRRYARSRALFHQCGLPRGGA